MPYKDKEKARECNRVSTQQRAAAFQQTPEGIAKAKEKEAKKEATRIASLQRNKERRRQKRQQQRLQQKLTALGIMSTPGTPNRGIRTSHTGLTPQQKVVAQAFDKLCETSTASRREEEETARQVASRREEVASRREEEDSRRFEALVDFMGAQEDTNDEESDDEEESGDDYPIIDVVPPTPRRPPRATRSAVKESESTSKKAKRVAVKESESTSKKAKRVAVKESESVSKKAKNSIKVKAFDWEGLEPDELVVYINSLPEGYPYKNAFPDDMDKREVKCLFKEAAEGGLFDKDFLVERSNKDPVGKKFPYLSIPTIQAFGKVLGFQHTYASLAEFSKRALRHYERYMSHED